MSYESFHDKINFHLTNEIKKVKRGKYVLFIITADPAKITVLDRIFKLNVNLLKYLFVRKEE